eukprot:420854_1
MSGDSSTFVSVICVKCGSVDLHFASINHAILTGAALYSTSRGSVEGPSASFMVNSYFVFSIYRTTIQLGSYDNVDVRINTLADATVYLGNNLNVRVNCGGPGENCDNVDIYSDVDPSQSDLSNFFIDCDDKCTSDKNFDIYFPNATPSPLTCAVQNSGVSAGCEFFPSSLHPTPSPSTNPSLFPTITPTQATLTPTKYPTINPTNAPSLAPTRNPTKAPSSAPTSATNSPSSAPTRKPTQAPSTSPSQPPTHAPSNTPTQPPTYTPTLTPTRTPSNAPTQPPSYTPTLTPTLAPSKAPSQTPTYAPTITPSRTPTNAPTQPPTYTPTLTPTLAPSKAPSQTPTYAPTITPSRAPSNAPTQPPTYTPTLTPSQAPSTSPSQPPTHAPSNTPTQPPTYTKIIISIMYTPILTPSQTPSNETSEEGEEVDNDEFTISGQHILAVIIATAICIACLVVIESFKCYAKKPKLELKKMKMELEVINSETTDGNRVLNVEMILKGSARMTRGDSEVDAGAVTAVEDIEDAQDHGERVGYTGSFQVINAQDYANEGRVMDTKEEFGQSEDKHADDMRDAAPYLGNDVAVHDDDDTDTDSDSDSDSDGMYVICATKGNDTKGNDVVGIIK